MAIPNLKRVKIGSAQELETWLRKSIVHDQPVMLVMHSQDTHAKFISVKQVNAALAAYGWSSGRRYTLPSDMIGHVVQKTG